MSNSNTQTNILVDCSWSTLTPQTTSELVLKLMQPVAATEVLAPKQKMAANLKNELQYALNKPPHSAFPRRRLQALRFVFPFVSCLYHPSRERMYCGWANGHLECRKHLFFVDDFFELRVRCPRLDGIRDQRIPFSASALDTKIEITWLNIWWSASLEFFWIKTNRNGLDIHSKPLFPLPVTCLEGARVSFSVGKSQRLDDLEEQTVATLDSFPFEFELHFLHFVYHKTSSISNINPANLNRVLGGETICSKCSSRPDKISCLLSALLRRFRFRNGWAPNPLSSLSVSCEKTSRKKPYLACCSICEAKRLNRTAQQVSPERRSILFNGRFQIPCVALPESSLSLIL